MMLIFQLCLKRTETITVTEKQGPRPEQGPLWYLCLRLFDLPKLVAVPHCVFKGFRPPFRAGRISFDIGPEWRLSAQPESLPCALETLQCGISRLAGCAGRRANEHTQQQQGKRWEAGRFIEGCFHVLVSVSVS